MANDRASKLKVLWATDGSAGAHNAIPFLHLLQPSIEELTVFTVAHHALALTGSAKRSAQADAEQLALKEVAQLAWDRPVQTGSRYGNPIQEILRQARTINADLVVLGAKGRSNLGMLLLGSVSHGVIQHATMPVLLAKGGATGVRRIVLGYDGTPPARKAVRFLERMELPAGAQVRLIHAIEGFALPPGTPVAYREMAIKEAHAINERQHKRASEGLKAVADLLNRTGNVEIQPNVETGDPAAVLLDASRREHADLLVVGSRKPSAVRHYLLGSTAEKLVRHADASVLVVR